MALSNEDFKKIMMTPRSDAASSFKTPLPVAKKDKKERKRDYKPRAPREPREDPMAGYRDRAAERRTGEAEEVPDVASLTAEVLASRAEDPEKAKADLELEREIAKHTDHAAMEAAAAAATASKKKSALDFKVLAQIRAEIEQEQSVKDAEEKARTASTKKEEEAAKPLARGPQTELGRIVARALTEGKGRIEVITPHRKLLRYNVSADAGADMPVMTILNKEDVRVDAACIGITDPRVGVAVAKVMSYLPRKENSEKAAARKSQKDKLKAIIEPTLQLVPLVLPTKFVPVAPQAVLKQDEVMKDSEKDEKKEAMPAMPVKLPPPVEDDDIFAGESEYVPEFKKKVTTADGTAKSSVSYFGGGEKLTGLEGFKLDGPKIKLKKGAMKEEDLAAAEAESDATEGEGDADMEVDQGAGAGAAAVAKAKAKGDFIPIESHTQRDGYVFKMGDLGLGLYRDAPAPALAAGPAPGPAMPDNDAMGYPEVEAYPNTDAQFQPPAPRQPTVLELAAQGQVVVSEKAITPQEAAKKGLVTVFKRDDERLRSMREKDKRERDPTFVSDNYAECYPGAFETTIEVYDAQSDEDDPSKIDHGTGAAARKIALKRWDFKTEEEWAAYNAQREANPKAAFQFGVKMGDGRKTRKDKDKDKPKKKKDYGAKVSADLQKVNALMKKREHEGKYETSKRSKMPEL